MPRTPQQDRHAPRAPAHHSHVLAARRDRYHRDRALARPRTRGNSPDLHPRRPDHQTARPRPDHATGSPPRPLPPARQAARLPRAADLTDPDYAEVSAAATATTLAARPGIGIIR